MRRFSQPKTSPKCSVSIPIKQQIPLLWTFGWNHFTKCFQMCTNLWIIQRKRQSQVFICVKMCLLAVSPSVSPQWMKMWKSKNELYDDGKWVLWKLEMNIETEMERERGTNTRESLIYLIYYSNAVQNSCIQKQCTGWKIAYRTAKCQHKTIVDLGLIAN